MQVKTVRLSSKGQITLPIEMLKAINADQGTEFLVVQDDERIVLMKASRVGKSVIDDLEGFEALALGTFEGLWDNEHDAVWDEA